MALATILGFGLGIMAAFAREQMNRQIHTRAQLESLLGTNCLAVIPAFAAKGSALRKHGTTKDSEAFRQISDVAPFSATAEALRYIKVAIDLHPTGGQGDRIRLGPSGRRKDHRGRAVSRPSWPRAAARTLLIDADLRNPSMTRTLDYTDARDCSNWSRTNRPSPTWS